MLQYDDKVALSKKKLHVNRVQFTGKVLEEKNEGVQRTIK